MKKPLFRKPFILPAAVLVLAAAALLYSLLLRSAPSSGYTLLVDGQPPASSVLSPEKKNLRILLTLDGKEIANLPFGEEHAVFFRRYDGAENLLRISSDAVWMESANCEGQDCVHMEKITRENLETRVMFGMIICLPHRLSAEVR